MFPPEGQEEVRETPRTPESGLSPEQQVQDTPPAQPQPAAQTETIQDKALKLLKGTDPEVAQYIANSYAQFALQDAVNSGRLIPKEKIPKPEPKPEPPSYNNPPPDFEERVDDLIGKGKTSKLLWELTTGASGMAVEEAKKVIQEIVEKEIGPLREQQAWSEFNRLEREFYSDKEDLDEDLRKDLSILMRREEGATGPEIYTLMKKYSEKTQERARQTAATQAHQRSEAYATGFTENPQRGGFNPPAGHQTEGLKKEILDAYKSGDEALATRLSRRWQGQ